MYILLKKNKITFLDLIFFGPKTICFFLLFIMFIELIKLDRKSVSRYSSEIHKQEIRILPDIDVVLRLGLLELLVIVGLQLHQRTEDVLVLVPILHQKLFQMNRI